MIISNYSQHVLKKIKHCRNPKKRYNVSLKSKRFHTFCYMDGCKLVCPMIWFNVCFTVAFTGYASRLTA